MKGASHIYIRVTCIRLYTAKLIKAVWIKLSSSSAVSFERNPKYSIYSYLYTENKGKVQNMKFNAYFYSTEDDMVHFYGYTNRHRHSFLLKYIHIYCRCTIMSYKCWKSCFDFIFKIELLMAADATWCKSAPHDIHSGHISTYI